MPPVTLDGSTECALEFATDFVEWWKQLDRPTKAELGALLDMLRIAGHTIKDKDTISRSLHYSGSVLPGPCELRKTVDDKVYRLAYVFHNQVAVILAGGFKTGNEDKFYKALLREAETSFTQYLSELEAERVAQLKAGDKVVKMSKKRDR